MPSLTSLVSLLSPNPKLLKPPRLRLQWLASTRPARTVRWPNMPLNTLVRAVWEAQLALLLCEFLPPKVQASPSKDKSQVLPLESRMPLANRSQL